MRASVRVCVCVCARARASVYWGRSVDGSGMFMDVSRLFFLCGAFIE